jgi:hypothetical protein
LSRETRLGKTTGLLSEYRKRRRRIRREVESRLGNQLSRYTRKISEIVGEPVPTKTVLTNKDIASVHKKIDSTVTLAASTFDVDWENIPPEEMQRRLQDFLDKLLGQFYTVPKGERVLTYLRNEIGEILHPRHDNPYQATFYEVSEAAGWLIKRLFQQDRTEAAQSFFTDFMKSQEVFSLAQIYIQSVLPTIRRLGRLEGKQLGRREIQSLIRSYELLAGVYEKLCRVIVVLNDIRMGKMSDDGSVSRRGLANILKEIQEEPKLVPIASRLSTKIRNSITHPSYRIYYAKRRIRFDDGPEMTWNQFRKRAIDLSLALVALTVMPFLHYLEDLLGQLDHALTPTTTTAADLESSR